MCYRCHSEVSASPRLPSGAARMPQGWGRGSALFLFLGTNPRPENIPRAELTELILSQWKTGFLNHPSSWGRGIAAAEAGVIEGLGWRRQGKPSDSVDRTIPSSLAAWPAASPPFFCKSDRLPGNCWGVRQAGSTAVPRSHSDPRLSFWAEQVPCDSKDFPSCHC